MPDTRQQQFDRLKETAGDRLVSSFGNYANCRSLLTFLCEKCDTPYKATEHDYLRSKRCHKCDVNHELIKRFRYIHDGYYDYDLSDVNMSLPLDDLHETTGVVVCPKHGKLPDVSIRDHLRGAGCDHCLVSNVSFNSTASDFINAACIEHNFHYRYDFIPAGEFSDHTQIKVTCPKHGVFFTTPEQHLSGDGCPVCEKTLSTIRDVTDRLEDEGVAYSTEKTFPGCVSEEGRALRFDLYIPQKHVCIEFDGVHHFQPTKYTDGVDDVVAQHYFDVQQRNDEKKHQYCIDHQIQLARIPFTDFHPETSVLRYLHSQPDKRLVYTWENFEHDIERIVNYIKTFNYSKFAVYGVSRGGLPFSVHISNHFEDQCQHGIVSFQRYDGNDKVVDPVMTHSGDDLPIFVIDDLISSGITMKKIINHFHTTNPNAAIHPIVIFGAANEDNVFFIRKHPKQWIVFPYEI